MGRGGGQSEEQIRQMESKVYIYDRMTLLD